MTLNRKPVKNAYWVDVHGAGIIGADGGGLGGGASPQKPKLTGPLLEKNRPPPSPRRTGPPPKRFVDFWG